MQKSASESTIARRCICCGTPMSDGKAKPLKAEHYGIKSYSEYHSLYNTMPWCRDCIVKMYKQFINRYQDERLALFYLCRVIDYPYIPKVLSLSSDMSPEELIVYYFQETKRDYINEAKAGFFAGEYIREIDLPVATESEVVDTTVIDFDEAKEERKRNLYIKWGRNNSYKESDYDDLEDIYQRIVTQNGIIVDEKTGNVADKVTELAVIEAACNLLQSRKARNANDADDTKKYYDLYDKAMASQLLRGKDLKDKQVGDVLVQDIVKYCESDGFIEPWNKKIKYPHKKDVVDQVLLHLMNYVGKLTADVFNKHVPKQEKLPSEYKLKYGNDVFPEEETDFDKLFDKSQASIADFKARQHISDDDSGEDSADLDDDNDTDAALLGEDGE